MAKHKGERKRSPLHASGDAWREGTRRLGDAGDKPAVDEAKAGKLTVNQRLDGLRDLFCKGDVGASIAHSEAWRRAHEAVEGKVKAYVDADPEKRRGAKAYAKWRKEIGKIDDSKAASPEAKAFQASGPRVNADAHDVHHIEFPKQKYPDSAVDPAALYPVRRAQKQPERASLFDKDKKSGAHADLHRATGKEGVTQNGAPALFHEMAILDDLSKETRRAFQRHLEHQSPASQSLKRAMGALRRDAKRRPQ